MKTKLFSIIFFLTLFTISAQVPSYVTTNGLIRYFSFSNNTNDLSSQSQNLVNYGATFSTDRIGNTNKAITLNTGQYLEGTDFGMPIMTMPRTVSFWINTNYNSNYDVQLFTICGYSPTNSISIAIKQNQLALGPLYYELLTNHYIGGPGWQNITVVFDFNNTTDVYANGTFINSFPLNISVYNGYFRIGSSSQNYSDIQIDDVAIWNRALTSQEIFNLFSNCTTPAAPVAAASQTICSAPAPTVASLTATGTSIQWYDAATGGNLLSNNTNLTNGQVVYASQTVSDCESTTRTAVTVNFNDPQITASATTVCSGTAVNLAASTTVNPLTFSSTCSIPTNLQTGLVGYYTLCGVDNIVMTGSGASISVHSTTPTADRFNNPNKAYLFNGLNSYINIGYNSQFNSQSITYSVWFKTNNIPNFNAELIRGGYGSISINNLNANNPQAGYPTITALNNTNTPINQYYQNSSVVDDNWHFAALTYDQSNGLMKLYIDGQIRISNYVGTSLPDAISDIYIGDSASNLPFSGKIDDFGFWNRALTLPEIQQLYSGATYLWSTGETTATINPTPTATTTYWCDVTVNGVTCRKYTTINVNSTTPAPTGAATQTFCATPAPTAADLVATGTGIQWYDAATAGNLVASTATLTNGQVLYASQTVSGCESTDRLAVTVSLNDLQITASATSVCSGTAVNLAASTTALPITTNSTLPTNLQNGLVGYWLFNGNANDASGNNNNGTVNGPTLSTDRFGNSSSAYSFLATDGGITVPAFYPLSTNYTISYWAKYDLQPINTSIFDISLSWLNFGEFVLYRELNNTITFGTAGSNGAANSSSINSLSSTNISNWYNIIARRNGNQLQLYVNGILESTGINNNINSGIIKTLYFGGDPNQVQSNNNARFNGKLDDIAIYNRALSPTEITQLYNINQTTYLWSTGETTATINPTPTATTTYWCDVTVNGVTCRKYSTINVNSTTPAPTGAATQTFCATPTPTVASLTATGTGVQWYDAATGGNLVASTATLTNGQVLYASQTVSSCESTDRLAVTINLNDPQITASATTICSGTAVSLFASTTANLAQNCNLPTNLQNGLVGYWPFCGNANDASGNGNNGTVNGATLTTDRFGNANSAYSFDGVSNKIEIDDNSSLHFGTLTSFSCSFWVKFNSNMQLNTIISKELPINPGDGFQLMLLSNKPRFDFMSSGPSQIDFQGLTSINDNNWHLVVFTANRSTNEMTFNIDGMLNSSLIDSRISNGNCTNSSKLRFGVERGAGSSGGCCNYNGILDDVTIYNRALSLQEIAQLYTPSATYLWSTGETTATINPTPTATTTYWCDVTVNGVTCRKNIIITVNSTTPAPTGAATQTFCATPAPTAADLVATGTGIQWYDAATAGTLVASTATLTNGQVLYASQTVSGCESTDRLAVTISLNDPQITASATTVCSGTSVNLSASTTATLAQNCNLPTNLQNGLVGYWPFCGNANDASGNGNNGTVNGATLTTDRFGNADSAYSFNNLSDVITIPSISPSLNNYSKTISAWLKFPNQYNFSSLAVVKHGTAYTSGFDLAIDQNNAVYGINNYSVVFLAGNGGVISFTSNQTELGNWVNLVATYDGNQIKLYLNGILKATQPYTGNLNCSNNNIYFGLWDNPTTPAVVARQLDDIGIWNRALTQTEIAQLYTPGTTYLWSTGETTATINPTPTATTTYWCDVTVNGVTCRKNIIITVNSTTPAPTGAATQTFCATPAPTAADLVATGTGIQWYDAATAGTLVASTATLTSGQVLYASQTVSGCESTDRLAVTISLNDPQITASATTVCSGTAVNLSASTAATLAQNCNLPTNLQNGLVGYWPFCGNANDASINGNNGTVNGATLTTDRFGNTNSAYSFDGIISKITCNPLNGITNTITLSTWIKSENNTGEWNGLVTTQNNTQQGFLLQENQNNHYDFTVSNGSGYYDLFSNNSISNEWKLLVCIIEPNILKIYVNGILDDSIQIGAYNLSSTANLNFGSRYLNEFYKGSLDDIGIWNRALSQAEIAQLYTTAPTYLWSTGETTATINPTPTATTTYWCDVTVNGVTCRKNITITVNSTTPAPTGAATQTFCATPTPTGADLVAIGTGIQWYDAATSGTLVASTATLTNGQVLYASQTVSGCESTDRLAVTVSLNDPQIIASATTVCSGTAVNLSASTTATLAQNCNLPTNLQNGLVGYWPFCGNANDASGSNNNGTVNGATITTDRFGNADSAYNFDGVNDFIQVTNSASLNLIGDFTLNAWVKIPNIYPSNSNFEHHFILSKNAGVTNQGTWQLALESQNNSNFQIHYNADPCFCLATMGGVNSEINSNNWEFISVNYSSINSTLNYFKNGNLVYSSNQFSYSNQNTNFDLLIGKENIGIQGFFNGKLDDITIYNRALSPSEISQLFTPGPTYLWSTGETTATINPTPTATTTYWCDVTVNGVTCRKYTTINVNSTTPAPTGAATQTFCATPAPTAADLVATGTGIQWYDGATGGNLVASTATLTNGQILYASQTVSGCESTDRLAVTISLNDPQITASATTVCSGTSVNLSASTTALPITTNSTLPTNLQNGLVGYWPFNGNANDESGNGNNGTINGALIGSDRFGTSNNSYSFNRNIQNEINVVNSNSLNTISNITISLWVKLSSYGASNQSGYNHYINKSDQNNNHQFVFANNNTELYFYFSGGGNYFPTNNLPPLNQWTNVIVTYQYDGTIQNSFCKFYINGNLVDSILTTQALNYSNYDLRIGDFGNNFYNRLDGQLDDIAIYNRALTPNEVSQLYNNNQTTYLWSTGETTATINPTPTATTTYWCDVTVNGMTCRKYSTITVDTALAPTVTTPVTYCQNSVASPLAATGANLLWYTVPTGTGSTTAPTPDTTTAGSTTYYVSQSIAGCESPLEPIVVTVIPTPSAPLVTTPLTYCQNSVAIPLAATGTNLLWYTAPNGGVGSATAPTPSTAIAGATTYYVSQTVSGCESPRIPLVVNITATPLAPAAPTPITYCQYSSASALTATGTNLLWYVSATGGIGSALAPTPSTAIAGTRTYYVSQTVSGCESPRTSIVVFVSPAPFTPIVTSPVTYCQNSSATPLTAVGFNLLWYSSATGGTGSATAPTPSTTTPGTTTYYVSQTVLGCESLRAAIAVTIFATPTTPTVTTPVVYCQDATATPLIALGQNILWYTTATGGTGTTTVPTPDTTTAGTTTYYASQTISGCEGPRTPIVVTVNATPTLPTVTTPVSYCQFDTAATLSATGANLLWYTTATGGIGTATAPTPTTSIAGTTSFYVSQTVLGCASPRAVIDVVINAVPQAPTGNTLQYFCANIYPTIQNLALTQNSIYWYSSATSQTALAPTTPLVPGTTYYAAQYNSATGCQSLTRLAVTAYVINENAPTLVDDLTFCDTDVKTIGEINTNGTNVIWYATPSGGIPLSNNYLLSSSQSLYAASYNTSSGCESIDRQMVTVTTVNCEVKANNLLTLDGNNLNDNLNIINIESFPANEIEIYNRYGQVVWRTENYNNTTNTFKGRANVGGVYQINENLPTGTYYYVLKYYNNYRNKYEVTKSFLYISNNN